MSTVITATSDSDAASTARAWLVAMNAHDADALCALLTEDFSWSDGPLPQGREGDSLPNVGRARAIAIRVWLGWFATTPDLSFELVHALRCGACVIQQLRIHGSQRVAHPDLFTLRPDAPLITTRQIDLPGCAVLTLRAGQVTQLWTYWNESALRGAPSISHRPADF